MKILWHGVAPWQPTGYGQQAALWATRLRKAGHEVAINAQGGSANAGTIIWEGIPVYPSSLEMEAVPLVSKAHAATFDPDLVITCYDGYQIGPGDVFKPYPVVSWLPIDTGLVTIGQRKTGGVYSGDLKWIKDSGAIPVAMSRNGQRLLAEAGYDAPHIPHGIDTTIFRPRPNRDQIRESLGLDPKTFVVGINATNIDVHRKGLAEQILAFGRFHVKHPDSLLYIHSMVHNPGSLNLLDLAQACGLSYPEFRITDQAAMYTGVFPQEQMAEWYSIMDVVMNVSRGEGFGLAGIEAQACGTPVILADAHTGPELVGPGWLVKTQPMWHWNYQSWWATALMEPLERALNLAYAKRGDQDLRDRCRRFAERFDVEAVWPLWEKFLEETEFTRGDADPA